MQGDFKNMSPAIFSRQSYRTRLQGPRHGGSEATRPLVFTVAEPGLGRSRRVDFAHGHYRKLSMITVRRTLAAARNRPLPCCPLQALEGHQVKITF